MIQESHSWAFIQIKTLTQMIHAHYYLQHYSQWPAPKQRRCPSTSRMHKEDVVRHAVEHWSSIRKWNNAICSNMNDLEMVTSTEWSGTEGQISHAIIYVCKLKQHDTKGRKLLVTQLHPTLVTPQSAAHQAPLTGGFSRQEYCRVASHSSRDSWPRDWSQVSRLASILPFEPLRKSWYKRTYYQKQK